MTRPSAHLDKKMIAAGKKIIMKEGSEGLTVRKICAKAGVNLGMFNYYFKTRDNYIGILAKEINNDFEKIINLDVVKDASSYDRLCHAINNLTKYVTKHRRFSAVVLFDTLIRFEYYKKLMVSGTVSSSNLLIDLILAAQKDKYLRSDVPIIEIYSMMLFNVFMPEMFRPYMNDVEDMMNIKKKTSIRKYPAERRIQLFLEGVRSK